MFEAIASAVREIATAFKGTRLIDTSGGVIPPLVEVHLILNFTEGVNAKVGAIDFDGRPSSARRGYARGSVDVERQGFMQHGGVQDISVEIHVFQTQEYLTIDHVIEVEFEAGFSTQILKGRVAFQTHAHLKTLSPINHGDGCVIPGIGTQAALRIRVHFNGEMMDERGVEDSVPIQQAGVGFHLFDAPTKSGSARHRIQVRGFCIGGIGTRIDGRSGAAKRQHPVEGDGNQFVHFVRLPRYRTYSQESRVSLSSMG